MKFVSVFKRNEEVDVEEYIGMVVGDKVKVESSKIYLSGEKPLKFVEIDQSDLFVKNIYRRSRSGYKAII